MKKVIVSVIVCLVFVHNATAEQKTNAVSHELTGAMVYYAPGDDDVYDSGYGVEGQIRFWKDEVIGFAFGVGFANWEVEAAELVISDPTMAIALSLEGDVLLVPIGGSVLVRTAPGQSVICTFEAGLRYVIVESDAEVSFGAANAAGIVLGGKSEIDIGNGVVGLIAAHIEGEIGPRVNLFGGIGYQFDIAEGDVEFLEEDIGENELKAFLVRLGLVVDL